MAEDGAQVLHRLKPIGKAGTASAPTGRRGPIFLSDAKSESRLGGRQAPRAVQTAQTDSARTTASTPLEETANPGLNVATNRQRNDVGPLAQQKD